MPSSVTQNCPLCSLQTGLYTIIDGVEYFECGSCDFIFADPELLRKLDSGIAVRQYDDNYWANELRSAHDRSFGSSLARMAEAILYCRIDVEKFVDIGTGPGYLLDAVALHLPSRASQFFGVERFPPDEALRTRHPNYFCSELADVGEKFECGVCIEVLEHLTPKMAVSLAEAIRDVSVEGSLYLFNTGLTDYVRREDPSYLDPYGRGHVTCWSIASARQVFEPLGFHVYPLRGKAWAFVIEYGTQILAGNIEDRIWSAPEKNVRLLQDPVMGSALYILGRESARAY